ncbi:RluA family pseudouridine synthase [Candidatus Saccharibacteria bacterium]|nr:RluA family pseudouridine synthase [Candidatus Saccharibacteria bacterium]MCB9821529.1 RluA family pseudouridine synthase [Candidatus Nomurabacteria bacterium]
MATKQIINITIDDKNLRADNVISRNFPMLSRSFIKKLAKENRLKFNDQPVSCGYKLRQTGLLVLDYDMTQLENIPELDLETVYEDKHIIVINKPSGVITHSRGKYWDEPSVASSIRTKLHKAGITDMRAGIVHRLDRATSGLLVCAKDSTTAAYLQQQFEKRLVEKTYFAIVPHVDLPKKGFIDKPIGRNLRKPSQFKVDPNGKEAQTEFEILEDTGSLLLLSLKPKTGRTHQLRVHMASLGVPIAGDNLYDSSLEAPRLMLHAAELTINYPTDSHKKTFTAALPKEFKDYLT